MYIKYIQDINWKRNFHKLGEVEKMVIANQMPGYAMETRIF